MAVSVRQSWVRLGILLELKVGIDSRLRALLTGDGDGGALLTAAETVDVLEDEPVEMGVW